MITQITGQDRRILSDVAYDSMMLFIGHSPDIKRIADRLCCGNMSQAWGDIIEKGILELIKICEMDEEVCKNETKEIVTIKPLKEVWRE